MPPPPSVSTSHGRTNDRETIMADRWLFALFYTFIAQHGHSHRWCQVDKRAGMERMDCVFVVFCTSALRQIFPFSLPQQRALYLSFNLFRSKNPSIWFHPKLVRSPDDCIENVMSLWNCILSVLVIVLFFFFIYGNGGKYRTHTHPITCSSGG